MEEWEYPMGLRWLEEEPHTIRRRTPEEEASALIAEELRRQHDALMFLLRKVNGE